MMNLFFIYISMFYLIVFINVFYIIIDLFYIIRQLKL